MFRWVDHTSELELEIEAASEPEVFADALAALSELLAIERRHEPRPARASGNPAPAERRRLSVQAPDRPALLAGWLEELVFLAESEGFVPAEVESLELGPDSAHATVAGFLNEPPPLVKAVTYHRLAFAQTGEGYCARVVLDV